jgi:hypothetical protein
LCFWQQWRLEASGHIVSVLDGMVLDVKHANKEKGASVCVYPRKNTNEANQLWYVTFHTLWQCGWSAMSAMSA